MAKKKSTKKTTKTGGATQAPSKTREKRQTIRGLEGLGAVMQKVHSREHAERLFAQITSGPLAGLSAPRGEAPPSAADVFGPRAVDPTAPTFSVDLLLSMSAKYIEDKNFRAFVSSLRQALSQRIIPQELRASLLPLINKAGDALHLQNDMASGAIVDAAYGNAKLDDITASVREMLSDFSRAALMQEEGNRLSEPRGLDGIEFPEFVERPQHIDAVPTVVITDHAVDDPAYYRLATCTYLVNTSCVGVPMPADFDIGDDGDIEALHQLAQAYSLKVLQRAPHHRLLVRPESDGAWFVILPSTREHYQAANVRFADTFHQQRSSIDAAMLRLRTQRARERRLVFEAKHADLIREIKEAADVEADLLIKSSGLRERFKEMTDELPSIQERRLRLAVARKAEQDAMTYATVKERFDCRIRWEDDVLGPALALRQEYQDQRVSCRLAKARRAELEAKLETMKAQERSPLAASLAPLREAAKARAETAKARKASDEGQAVKKPRKPRKPAAAKPRKAKGETGVAASRSPARKFYSSTGAAEASAAPF